MNERLRELLPNIEGMNEDEIRERYPHVPRIYNASTDEMRFATQSDIDRLIDIARTFGEISRTVLDYRERYGIRD